MKAKPTEGNEKLLSSRRIHIAGDDAGFGVYELT